MAAKLQARREKYLKILGLPTPAGDACINQAYRQLAYQWHPDKNHGNEEAAKVKFQQISKAYTRVQSVNRRIKRLDEELMKVPALKPGERKKRKKTKSQSEECCHCGRCLNLEDFQDSDSDTKSDEENECFSSDEWTDSEDEESEDDWFEMFFRIFQEVIYKRRFQNRTRGRRNHHCHCDVDEEEKEEEEFFSHLFENRKRQGFYDDNLTEEDLKKFQSYEDWLKTRDPSKRHNTRVRRARKKANKPSLEKPKPPSKKELKREHNRREKEIKEISLQLEKDLAEKRKKQKQEELKPVDSPKARCRRSSKEEYTDMYAFPQIEQPKIDFDEEESKDKKKEKLKRKKEAKLNRKQLKIQTAQNQYKIQAPYSPTLDEKYTPLFEQEDDSKGPKLTEGENNDVCYGNSSHGDQKSDRDKHLRDFLAKAKAQRQKATHSKDENQNPTVQSLPKQPRSMPSIEHNRKALLDIHIQRYNNLMKDQPRRHTEQQLEEERRKEREAGKQRHQEELDRLRSTHKREFEDMKSAQHFKELEWDKQRNLDEVFELQAESGLDDIAAKYGAVPKSKPVKSKKPQKESGKNTYWKSVNDVPDLIEVPTHDTTAFSPNRPKRCATDLPYSEVAKKKSTKVDFVAAPRPAENIWLRRNETMAMLQPMNAQDEEAQLCKALELSMQTAIQEEARARERIAAEKKKHIPPTIPSSQSSATKTQNQQSTIPATLKQAPVSITNQLQRAPITNETVRKNDPIAEKTEPQSIKVDETEPSCISVNNADENASCSSSSQEYKDATDKLDELPWLPGSDEYISGVEKWSGVDSIDDALGEPLASSEATPYYAASSGHVNLDLTLTTDSEDMPPLLDMDDTTEPTSLQGGIESVWGPVDSQGANNRGAFGGGDQPRYGSKMADSVEEDDTELQKAIMQSLTSRKDDKFPKDTKDGIDDDCEEMPLNLDLNPQPIKDHMMGALSTFGNSVPVPMLENPLYSHQLNLQTPQNNSENHSKPTQQDVQFHMEPIPNSGFSRPCLTPCDPVSDQPDHILKGDLRDSIPDALMQDLKDAFQQGPLNMPRPEDLISKKEQTAQHLGSCQQFQVNSSIQSQSAVQQGYNEQYSLSQVQQGINSVHQGPTSVQQGLYPLEQGHIPGQQGQTAGQHDSFLVQQGQIPVHQDSFPVQQGQTTGQHDSFLVQQGQIPVHQGSFPMQQGQTTGQHGSFPVQRGHIPLQQGSFPLQQGQTAGQQGSFPVQQGQTTGQHGSFPVQQGLTFGQQGHVQGQYGLNPAENELEQLQQVYFSQLHTSNHTAPYAYSQATFTNQQYNPGNVDPKLPGMQHEASQPLYYNQPTSDPSNPICRGSSEQQYYQQKPHGQFRPNVTSSQQYCQQKSQEQGPEQQVFNQQSQDYKEPKVNLDQQYYQQKSQEQQEPEQQVFNQQSQNYKEPNVTLDQQYYQQKSQEQSLSEKQDFNPEVTIGQQYYQQKSQESTVKLNEEVNLQGTSQHLPTPKSCQPGAKASLSDPATVSLQPNISTGPIEANPALEIKPSKSSIANYLPPPPMESETDSPKIDGGDMSTNDAMPHGGLSLSDMKSNESPVPTLVPPNTPATPFTGTPAPCLGINDLLKRLDMRNSVPQSSPLADPAVMAVLTQNNSSGSSSPKQVPSVSSGLPSINAVNLISPSQNVPAPGSDASLMASNGTQSLQNFQLLNQLGGAQMFAAGSRPLDPQQQQLMQNSIEQQLHQLKSTMDPRMQALLHNSFSPLLQQQMDQQVLKNTLDPRMQQQQQIIDPQIQVPRNTLDPRIQQMLQVPSLDTQSPPQGLLDPRIQQMLSQKIFDPQVLSNNLNPQIQQLLQTLTAQPMQNTIDQQLQMPTEGALNLQGISNTLDPRVLQLMQSLPDLPKIPQSMPPFQIPGIPVLGVPPSTANQSPIFAYSQQLLYNQPQTGIDRQKDSSQNQESFRVNTACQNDSNEPSREALERHVSPETVATHSQKMEAPSKQDKTVIEKPSSMTTGSAIRHRMRMGRRRLPGTPVVPRNTTEHPKNQEDRAMKESKMDVERKTDKHVHFGNGDGDQDRYNITDKTKPYYTSVNQDERKDSLADKRSY